ncbi:pyruvate/2-oxoglutarate dehydrogenase complex dihydrolipoamide dehydrogenase (E3) component [Kushneria sinocarnis]|uniref:Soluble pyridine nucleotide transhydrogenase n=1 Tax=Kushneria sinocarnis TaxID=595502 RepID=A0A420WYX1_9GAMM|nr:Si-specific NAD(P)(+) transhydrogenase [Kushneria sinocarnis]RKR06376.1 pyruvate/2-oxoglutarate dehydrogenase complex dihydrolipoamide dehydrogenase (E3) component [Kushneria sinocarnis]
MTVYHYDVVVIGSGPAGESAAINAAKHDRRVAIVDAQTTVGGNCTHRGTIPSKALRHAVKQLMQFRDNPLFREIAEPRGVSFPRMLERSRRVIEQQVEMRTAFYSRNRIDVHHGMASFSDPHSLVVRDAHEGHVEVRADNFVIATGSRPYRPKDINFRHPRIFCSDTILGLSHTPRRMIIYGAGVIGSEYASIFSGLGVKVDLIDTRDRLLSFLDDEISDALSYHLRNNGVQIRHNEEYERVEGDDTGVTLHLRSGKRLRADTFMWANGRTGNTDQLGLDKLGLEANSRGQLQVDEHYRTTLAHVHAAGDVIGWPSLASAAYDQGRSASGDALNGAFRYVNDIPTGIYTIPEISSLGRNERELTEARIPYEVGQAFFKDTARAQITGDTVGMLKILFHPDTLEIFGIHCFGDQASEIVHIGQAIMNQPGDANTLNYFVNTTFNYPTMAEAYRIAAYNGLNRLC